MKPTHSIILLLLAFSLYMIWYSWNEPGQGNESVTSNARTHAEQDYTALLQRLDVLEHDLNQQIIARQQLEKRIYQLENQNLSSETRVQNQQPEPSGNVSASSQGSSLVEDETTSTSIQQKLVNIGVAEETASMIKQFVDNNRLQRLQLRDQASREGWINSDRFITEMHAIGDDTRGLKEEYGEAIYDQYLYASGRPNRVVVREVFSGSSAQNAGIKAGDIIISYGNETIYSMNDLRQATVKGNPGDSTLVELLRGNQPYSTTVSRGPLGISMESTRIHP